MVNWLTILIIAAILVTLDKGITALNIKAVEKNIPGVDPYSIEKNPVAKVFFERYGLYGGTVLYWIFSIITFMLAVWLLHYPARIIAPDNAYGVALYAVVIMYFFVLGNNFYFWFRYNKLLV
jgi:hypothetical protein